MAKDSLSGVMQSGEPRTSTTSPEVAKHVLSFAQLKRLTAAVGRSYPARSGVQESKTNENSDKTPPGAVVKFEFSRRNGRSRNADAARVLPIDEDQVHREKLNQNATFDSAQQEWTVESLSDLNQQEQPGEGHCLR